MKLAILVTDLGLKKAQHTTIRLAREATNREHEVWVFTAGDFSFDHNDRLWLRARRCPKKHYKAGKTYLKDLRENPVEELVAVRDLDAILLRDNPARYNTDNAWAKVVGPNFGRMATKEGVLVLNDPDGLAGATNKLYFQNFPSQVRPLTLISRSRQEISDFAQTLKGHMILKPLQGSGGEGVFLVEKGASFNLNQLSDALFKSGYVIAQEYLPAAKDGDIRIFLMNGRPLTVKGKVAAFHRRGQGDDIRSNIHAGGRPEAVVVTDESLELCEAVRPQLVADGMFLVGLDIVGTKVIEINLFCPGGLARMEDFEGVNFSAAVLASIEKKVRAYRLGSTSLSNKEMATY